MQKNSLKHGFCLSLAIAIALSGLPAVAQPESPPTPTPTPNVSETPTPLSTETLPQPTETAQDRTLETTEAGSEESRKPLFWIFVLLLVSLGWNVGLTIFSILAKKDNQKIQEKLDRKQSSLSQVTNQQIQELLQIKSVIIPGLQQQIRDLQTSMKGAETSLERGISAPPNQYSYPQQTSPIQSKTINSQRYQGSTVVNQSYNSLPSNPWDHIVQYYESNSAYLESYAVGVSETENSILRRRQNGSTQEVTLSQTTNSSYWIIAGQDAQSYWLVPKPDLRFRPGVFETFQSLFNYSPEYQPGLKIHLVKPAQVEQSSSGEWELADKGEVQFTQ